MVKVAFVCLGNICRSPMGELIFRDLLQKRGLSDKFEVSSYGTSAEEEGNPIYPPARSTLAAHGISGTHVARKITQKAIAENDYLLVMDSSNERNLLRIAGEHAHKIHKLCSYTATPRDVADPWYTRDFERAFADIKEGCEAFLEFVLHKE